MIYTNKEAGDLIEQAAQHMPFTYEEFLDFLYAYSEVSFYYQGLQYGATLGYHPSEDFLTVDFFACDTDNNDITTYNGMDDFAVNAQIEGKLLKNIWSKVTNVYYLD